MSILLRVDASFRTQGSVTRAVADSAENAWLARHPEGTVVRRDLGAHPLPAEAWSLATGALFMEPEVLTEQHRTAQKLARTLAEEIISADAVILASPLYNYGVSHDTKAWIDMLISSPELGPAPEPETLRGKPMLLITAQGGSYREGSPRYGWDYNTPYLRRIFAENFFMDVEIVVAEFTLASVNPGLADFIGIADQSLATAHEAAKRHGTELADRLQDSW